MKKTKALKVVVICLCIVALCVGIAYSKKCKAVYMVDYVNGTPQIPEIEGAEVIGYSVYKDKVTGNGRVKIQLEFDDDADCTKRKEMKRHMQHVKDIEEDDQGEDEQ